MIEPFGYFRAEPFGWVQCAETDEGAVALYDRAAIDAAYERAAELCEETDDDPHVVLHVGTVCAAVIRALKGSK